METMIAIWMCVAFWATCLHATPDEERLYKDLFAFMNPVVRPVDNASQPVVVTIGAALHIIVEMDERNQHITTSVWMRFHWADSYLRWDPDDYGDTKSLVVPLDRVWKPDIVLYNNVDDEHHGMLDSNVILSHFGVVFWNTPAIFKSSCNIDISYFPFDEQHCILKFGSWSYDAHGIDLVNKSSEGDMSLYIDAGEWDLIGIPVKRNEVLYSCCPAPYPDITFTIIIRRRPFFYLFNIMVPCLLTSFITALNFLLPADSGEKVGMVLTVLLALTVFLLIIAETIPPSAATPLIGQYFMGTIFIVSLSALFTVIVLRLHYQLPGVTPVPLWLRKLVFAYMAPVLCVKVSYSNGKPVSPLEFNSRRPCFLKTTQAKKSTHFCGTSNPEDNPAFSELLRSVASINENLSFMTSRLSDNEGDEDVLTQWKYVALVFDRLFFWVYLLMTLMTTIIIFGQRKPHSTM